jgi:membrane fusion protein, multidrug efflux system
VVDAGKVKLNPVKTGIDDGLWVEVVEGLTGEEDVVVVGKSGLIDGQAVQSSPYNLPTGKPAKQKM